MVSLYADTPEPVDPELDENEHTDEDRAARADVDFIRDQEKYR